MSAQTFADRIAGLDVSIFKIESQTTADDRRSLLAVQNAVRTAKDGYAYLECGSHLGGSLLPHLLDSRCRLVYSVDKRPASQPDERGFIFPYVDNLTKRMLDTLAPHVPAEGMKKLATFDMDASELSAKQITEKPDLVLLDAEHTVRAAFRDFLNLSKLCGPSTVYAFHDANLIYTGLQNIETFLQHSGIAFDSYVLRDAVYVLATNDARDVVKSVGQRFGVDKEAYWRAAQSYLMQQHYEIVRSSLQPPPQWQTSGTIKARL